MGFVKFKIIKCSTQVQAIAGFHEWKTLRKHWGLGVEMKCFYPRKAYSCTVKSKGIFFSFCQGCNLIDIFAPYGNQSNNWRIWKISLFWFFRVFYFPPKERTVSWNQSSHVTHVTQSTSNSAARFTHGLNLPHSTRNYIFFVLI